MPPPPFLNKHPNATLWVPGSSRRAVAEEAGTVPKGRLCGPPGFRLPAPPSDAAENSAAPTAAHVCVWGPGDWGFWGTAADPPTVCVKPAEQRALVHLFLQEPLGRGCSPVGGAQGWHWSFGVWTAGARLCRRSVPGPRPTLVPQNCSPGPAPFWGPQRVGGGVGRDGAFPTLSKAASRHPHFPSCSLPSLIHSTNTQHEGVVQGRAQRHGVHLVPRELGTSVQGWACWDAPGFPSLLTLAFCQIWKPFSQHVLFHRSGPAPWSLCSRGVFCSALPPGLGP